MEFKTKRLEVKKFIPEYIPIMYESWGKDAEVGRYLPGFKKDFSLEDFTYYILNTNKSEYEERFIIQIEKTNEVIGYMTLYKEDSRSKSINIIIEKDKWGNGYGKEVLQKITEIEKSNGLGSIYATCDSNNQRAIAMLDFISYEQIDSIPGDRIDLFGIKGDELLYEKEMIRVHYND